MVESGEVKGATGLLSLLMADKSAHAASADYVVGFADALLVVGVISSAQWAEVTNWTINSGR